MGKVVKKVALVSGAARGLGKSIAEKLLESGWSVSVGSRQPPKIAHNKEQFQWSYYDARDIASEEAWVSSAVEYFGQIDALVLNSGVLSSTSVIDATEKEIDYLLEVNVKSPRRLAQLAWPYLQVATNGKVVIIASLAGKRVRTAESSLYSLSKAAALSLTHGIRHCGEPVGIRATAICPGFIATDMASAVPEEMKENITLPQDVARVVQMVLELPFTASIAEIPINWRVESEY